MVAQLFRFTIAQGASVKDAYQELQNTPDGFVDSLVKRGHKVGPKDGTAIILARFDAEKHYIEQKNVTEVTGLALDFDGKYKVDGKTVYERLDVEAVLAQLPFKGVAHSSYSHTADFPKFRVLIPLAEPISINEHRRLWWWFYELTGKKADPSGKNADRIFFLPRAPDEEALKVAWIRPLTGPVLDYKKVVPASYEPPEQAHDKPKKQRGAHRAPAEARTYKQTDPHLLLERLAELPLFVWACENPAEVTREVWRGIATNIAAAVLDDENAHDDGAALFHEISEYDTERYNYAIAEKTFRDALRSAQSYGPMTFQHFVTNGAPADVCDDRGMGAKSPLGLVRMTTRTPRPKSSTPAPAETAPVESGDQMPTDYSGTSPSTSETPSSTPIAPSSAPPKPASAPSGTTPTPASASPASNPSSTNSASSAGSDDDEDLADDDFLKFDFKKVLFDRTNNQWLLKDDAGDWHPMTPSAFNEMLNNMGVPPKRLAGVRARFTQFQYSAPVWDKPDQELVNRHGVNVLNTYKKSTLEPKAGPWDDIRKLIENLCGGDNAGVEYTLDWLAAPVQSLRKNGQPMKMGTALVFHGDQGSGKGTLGQIMAAIYGKNNIVTIGQNELDNRFNGELLDKLFVIANEIMSSTNRSAETANKIKPWVTDPEISVEEKFRGAKTVKNDFNIVFTSNDERPVIVEKGDRRFSVFKSSKLDEATGQRLHDDLAGPLDQVAAFLDHLLNRQVTIKYGQLYISAARVEMIAASAPSEERFVQAVIEDGWLSVAATWIDAAPNGKIREPTVNNGFVLSTTLREVYEDFCKRNGIRPRGPVYLGKAMRLIEGAVQTKEYYGNVQQRGWTGIPLRSPAEVIELEKRKQERAEQQQAPSDQKPVNNI